MLRILMVGNIIGVALILPLKMYGSLHLGHKYEVNWGM